MQIDSFLEIDHSLYLIVFDNAFEVSWNLKFRNFTLINLQKIELSFFQNNYFSRVVNGRPILLENYILCIKFHF